MALILIRGDNDLKIVNSIMLLQVQGRLKLLNHPKLINPYFADSMIRRVLKSNIKRRSTIAVAFNVEESDSYVIKLIMEIHPPSHVVVINKKYAEYSKIQYMMNGSDDFEKFESYFLHADSMIDYSFDKKHREIKNNKVNSYVNR